MISCQQLVLVTRARTCRLSIEREGLFDKNWDRLGGLVLLTMECGALWCS